MAEYIEREVLWEEYLKSPIYSTVGGVFVDAYRVQEAIKTLPAADVVEVVRCKDCEYKSEWANDGSYPNYNFCKHSGLWHLTDNHFCSYGKRKEGVDND